MERKGLVGGITLGIIFVIAIIILINCTVKVPAGYVAIQYSVNGGVKNEVLTQGWHFTSPLINTTLYSVGIEQSYLTKGKQGDSSKNERFTASSSEGKSVGIDLTFTYQYSADSAAKVFTQFKGQNGKEIRDSFIKPNIISWSKEIIARYEVADIIGAERANINSALTTYLADKFAPYNITISNVSLINISVDKSTRKVINDKISAQQNAETQAIKNQTNVDKATADATVKTTKAQAKADAMLIKAKAEKEANELLNESLSEKVLQQSWINKWNGVLPKFSTTDSSSTILDISALEED